MSASRVVQRKGHGVGRRVVSIVGLKVLWQGAPRGWSDEGWKGTAQSFQKHGHRRNELRESQECLEQQIPCTRVGPHCRPSEEGSQVSLVICLLRNKQTNKEKTKPKEKKKKKENKTKLQVIQKVARAQNS